MITVPQRCAPFSFLIELISVCVLISLSSFGQTASCDCSGPLSSDLVDVTSSTQYRKFKDFLYRYFDSDKEHRELMKKEEGGSFVGNFGFVIEGLPFEASSDAEYKKNDFNQVFDRLRQTYVTNKLVSDDELNTLFAKRMGENQLKAYIACLDACKVSNGAGFSTILGGDLLGDLFIQVNFNSIPPNGKVVLNSAAIFTNLEPIGELIFKEKLIINDKDNIIQYFRRINPEKISSFALNVSGVTFKPVDIAAIKVSKGNSNLLPIGTIIVSVLDYKSFLKANDFDEEKDMAKAIWVPCDGRSLGKSVYSGFAGSVPDLRGLFLRGVNDYGVPYVGVSVVDDKRKNTEAKNAGDFQDDGIGLHTHALGSGAADASTMIFDNGTRLPSFLNDRYTNSNAVLRTAGNSNNKEETRPRNMSVYYYLKIN